MSEDRQIEVGDGRKFRLRTLKPSHMLDLMEAAENAASSRAWMQYALMICSVSEIDGVPVIMPTTKAGVRSLADRVGNAGIVALHADMQTPPEAADDVAKN